jgi:hypothetical protein
MIMTEINEINSSEVTENTEVKKIESERVGGNILDVSPDYLAVELPCGYIHSNELHSVALVKEMGGEEEDLIVGKGPTVSRMNQIIANCLVKLGTITDRHILRMAAEQLVAQDRMAIIIALRRITVGDFWECEILCPKEGCNCKMHTTLDLRNVSIVPMKDRMLRNNELTLPKSGKVVKWHVMKSEDEQWLADAAKKKEDLLTLQLMSRTDEVDGVKLDRKLKFKDARKILKSLGMKDRAALRTDFEAIEADIDTDIEYTCDDCGFEWSMGMDFSQQSFFFPSETRRRT